MRLTENPRALHALSQDIPDIVKEKKLVETLDENSRKQLKSLSDLLEKHQ